MTYRDPEVLMPWSEIDIREMANEEIANTIMPLADAVKANTEAIRILTNTVRMLKEVKHGDDQQP